MKKSILITCIVISIALSSAFSQNQVVKTVFASAGEVTKSGSYIVEWTIGETITGSNESSNNKAYQGFHHPLSNVRVGANDFNDLATKVTLFPNPVSEKELIVQFKDWTGQAALSIFDLNGRILWQKQLPNITDEAHKIDVGILPDGNYFLSIKEKEHQPFVKKFSIVRH
jgi:Secretion system C-terminal sorting domain